jgi:hypothetical protein
MAYLPAPLDTENTSLPPGLEPLLERLAENAHEIWARQRMQDGWVYGPERNDLRKTHPGIRSYAELCEAEKEYDRLMSQGTLKAILALGYSIKPT